MRTLFAFHFDNSLKVRAADFGKRNDRSISSVIHVALYEFLEKHDNTDEEVEK